MNQPLSASTHGVGVPPAKHAAGARSRTPLADLPINTQASATAGTAADAAMHRLHSSLDTTHSPLNSSASEAALSVASSDASSIPSSNAASPLRAAASSLACGESLEETDAGGSAMVTSEEVSSLSANYDALAAQCLKLASQAHVDRVHIQALSAQRDAAQALARDLRAQLSQAQSAADEWQRKADAGESLLRHTQILLACLREAHETPQQAHAAAYAAQPARRPGEGSGINVAVTREQILEEELRRTEANYRALVQAKDSSIAALTSERDEALAALHALRAEYSEAMERAAEARYTDALLAHEQRVKFQTLMEGQLEQQRRATEEMAALARARTALPPMQPVPTATARQPKRI